MPGAGLEGMWNVFESKAAVLSKYSWNYALVYSWLGGTIWCWEQTQSSLIQSCTQHADFSLVPGLFILLLLLLFL